MPIPLVEIHPYFKCLSFIVCFFCFTISVSTCSAQFFQSGIIVGWKKGLNLYSGGYELLDSGVTNSFSLSKRTTLRTDILYNQFKFYDISIEKNYFVGFPFYIGYNVLAKKSLKFDWIFFIGTGFNLFTRNYEGMNGKTISSKMEIGWLHSSGTRITYQICNRISTGIEFVHLGYIYSDIYNLGTMSDFFSLRFICLVNIYKPEKSKKQ